MKINIPLLCPSCGGKMILSGMNHHCPLKKRSRQVCKECTIERNSKEFKKSIGGA